MAKHERICAVRRVIGLVEGLIAAFDEVADELAQMEDEFPDAAMLNTASDWLEFSSSINTRSRISRFRAPGVVDPAKRYALIAIGEKTKLLYTGRVRFPNGGGWCYFICPKCARRVVTLYLINDAPRVATILQLGFGGRESDVGGLVPLRPTRSQAEAALAVIRDAFKTFCFADAKTISGSDGVSIVDLGQAPGMMKTPFSLCCSELCAAPVWTLRRSAVSRGVLWRVPLRGSPATSIRRPL
jgi:hypothetical protein